MIRTRSILCAVALALACAVPASASVQLRFGVRPDTLVHCGRGQMAFALWNDGTDSLRVRLSISLSFEDTVTIGPRDFRARLGPHDILSREFDFPVPPALPIGRYAVRMLAVASDSSRAEAVARFVVAPSRCTIGDSPATPATLLLDGIANGLGLDVATPTLRATWGGFKRRYDSNIR